jgi:hypothetical protein
MGTNDSARVAIIALLGALGLSACEGNHVHRPPANAIARVAGHLPASYQIPLEHPRGDVRIASSGVSNLESKAANDSLRAIHVRMVVTNNDLRAWTVDARQQLIDLAGHGLSAPAFVSSDADPADLPLVTIPVGCARTVDLFYLLPTGLQHAAKIPEYDALWRVSTASQLVEEHTPFDRLRLAPLVASGNGVSGPFWYDPLYPYGGFVSAVVVPSGFAHDVEVAPAASESTTTAAQPMTLYQRKPIEVVANTAITSAWATTVDQKTGVARTRGRKNATRNTPSVGP